MKNKLVSLILGLIVILVSTMITSCNKADIAKNDAVVTSPAITAEVSNALYVLPEVAQCRDVMMYSTADVVPVNADLEEPETGVQSLIDWRNILNIILLIISSLFAVYWGRARAVIDAISNGLKDNNLSKEEIENIVKAFKGK